MKDITAADPATVWTMFTSSADPARRPISPSSADPSRLAVMLPPSMNPVLSPQ